MDRKKLYEALSELKASARPEQVDLILTLQEEVDALNAKANAREPITNYSLTLGVLTLQSPGAYAGAAERQRQIDVKNYTADRDDQYVNGELACAAAWYALPPESDESATCARPLVLDWAERAAKDGAHTVTGTLWPKGWEVPAVPAYNDSASKAEKIAMRKRELEKGMALMAAEWDRLHRRLLRL